MNKLTALGIIAEYNPFHNGHLYQIKKAREITGCDCVIAIISGNFVQRGEPAILDKFSRAETALMSGVDLCIQLPTRYSIASAESFGNKAVTLLNYLQISKLCFGCETDNISMLSSVARLLSYESDEYKTLITNITAKGLSFPAARQKAVSLLLGNEYNDILKGSNNILAVEYLKSIEKNNFNITPVPIKRVGDSYNDTSISSDFASATAIREHIINNSDISEYVPKETFEFFRSYMKSSNSFVEPDDLSSFLEYALCNLMYEADYEKNNFILLATQYPDLNKDIASRIYIQLIRDNYKIQSFTNFAKKIKSKQYTLSRIKRILLGIVLNIKNCTETTDYVRILGFNSVGQQYLNQIKKENTVPVVTKAADYSDLLKEEIHATSVYNALQRIHLPEYNKNELTCGIIRIGSEK